MKTSLVILASVLLIAGIIGVAYAAAPGNVDVGASVTVNAYKDVTVTPCASPLSFGSLNPGTDNNPVTPGCVNGDIIVVNNPSSNGAVAVSIKGTDFAGTPSGTIAVGQVGWDKDDTPTTTTAMTTTLASVEAALAAGNDVDMYFFLDVPNAATAASYSSIFTVNTA